jgi:hypothetical protein
MPITLYAVYLRDADGTDTLHTYCYDAAMTRTVARTLNSSLDDDERNRGLFYWSELIELATNDIRSYGD